MTAPVYVCESLAEQIAAGSLLTLDGAEGRHSADVRRTRAGERIDLVDGRGLRAECLVEEVKPGTLLLRAHQVCEEGEPSPRRIIVQALAKRERDERAVEICTEYGAYRFIPWQAQRSIATWRGKEAKGVARWASVARAAMKQSRRSWLPLVDGACVTTKELAGEIRHAAEAGARIFLCHEEAEELFAEVLAGEGESEETWIIVGPEGGISGQEVELLTEAGARLVLLAPHVLRSSSAGAWALASAQTLSHLSGKVNA